MGLSLRDSIELHLEYDDRSTFGTVISGQLEARLKHRFRAVAEMLERETREVVERGPALLAELLGPNASGELFSAPRVVREDLAYPSPTDARPVALRVVRPDVPAVQIALAPSLAAELASWLGEWQRGGAMPVSGAARDLWIALSEHGCFGDAREPTRPRGPVTFVGHATVLLSGPRTKILIDPFLLARSENFPTSYQPLTFGDFEPDAVLITHSHRDHFHVDSLLRLGKDTPIFVPEVPRESALSVDMVYRLNELGFSRARALRWHEEIQLGDFRVIALPFYGEQPTTEEVLEPDEVRNIGNNYLVEGAGRRYAFVADAGRDRRGDVRSVATAAFVRYGAVDVLFGGYRSWSLYPIQYALTSVPQYLVFTPPSVWPARQKIMNDAHALLDTAERWHARHVVPYADGGAPWYWDLGLGPRMDGTTGPENPYFDPRPEAVVRAAAERSSRGSRSVPSAVETRLMRPGESLDFDAEGTATVVPNDGHLWPYAQGDAVLTTAELSEPVGLSRKRVLLRILASEELKRRGLVVTTQQVREMSDDLRQLNGLVDHGAMLAWLDRAGLTMTEYCEIVFEWQGIIQLEGVLADAIEKRLAGQRAFASMRRARQP